jgi:hypothetical protein
MAEWQKEGEGRIGNTAEPCDAPVGHFPRNPKGRGPFDRRRRHASLMGMTPTSLLAPGQRRKIPCVVAMA